MDRIPTKEQVERIREKYPVGTRIVVTNLNDPYTKIPAGTKGTVVYVDDMGQLGMHWDNGSALSLIPGVDFFHTIPQPEKNPRDLER